MKRNLLHLSGTIAVALALAITTAGAPPAAHAVGTTWWVQSAGDGAANVVNCPGAMCRLRDAIAAAGAGDIIKFSVTGTITMATGDPFEIDHALEIAGPGTGLLTIDADNLSRIFTISAGTVSISGLTLTHGLVNDLTTPAGNRGGGAILNFGHLTLDSMVIDDNQSSCLVSCNNNGVNNRGGGIASGADSALTITNSIITNNVTVYHGGGIAFNSTDAVGHDLVLTDVKISANQATDLLVGSGGGIQIGAAHAATLQKVLISSNSAGYLGGGLSGWTPPITITRSTIWGNHSSGNGGGIVIWGSLPLSLKLGQSAVYDNSADLDGGGMYVIDAPVTVYNSTFNGNSSGAHEGGGGIYSSGSTLALYNDTIAGNITYTGHGGGLYADTGYVPMMNTILADNASSDCRISGATTVSVNNLIEVNDPIAPCPAPAMSTDPKLAPLADNSGWTKTEALFAGSPAIDAGNPTACAEASTVNGEDQRGISRPQGVICDIGAYERTPVLPHADFEGDRSSDMAYFHGSTGLWGVLQSSDAFSYGSPLWFSWGQTGDIVVPGDYDGDRSLDPAVRRPPAGGQSAAYLVLQSSTGYDYGSALSIPAGWPGLGDTPVPADYNGDGITDPAIWRANTGAWMIPLSPAFTGYYFSSWGVSGDIPVGADVDNDGEADIGYFRPSTGTWGFLLSSHGYSYYAAQFFSWGSSTDTPVMADYDGDGKGDPAVVIPPAGGESRAYRILLSSLNYDTGASVTFPAGWPGLNDTPIPLDFDGDGKADPGIWRGNTGVWIIPKSSTSYTGYLFAAWGANGDQVVK